jgi:CPA1 family monovalent cation:H+ antiporter
MSSSIRKKSPSSTSVGYGVTGRVCGGRFACCALALPLTIAGSSPFPNRDLIIFLTFCVIFSTLVLQGLTLRPMIKWFGIQRDGKELREEQDARLKVASSIIEHIEENYSRLGDSFNQIKSSMK